jgi:hypothetical protein
LSSNVLIKDREELFCASVSSDISFQLELVFYVGVSCLSVCLFAVWIVWYVFFF